jgi:superoxide dismutase, Fe-Mn family
MTMHHRILPIPCKPYSLNWLPERLIVSHYENNYGAAVRSLNALRERLAGLDPTTAATGEIRALRREELSATASVVLHELYFANLSGDRKVPPAMMADALEEHFGGADRWRRDFVGAARSLAGGSGWVLLSYSPHEGRLYNQMALEDAETVPGSVPLLVLDMYEHAYHLEFGANATAYVEAFMRLIEWNVVTERLKHATSGHQPRGSQPSDDALPSVSVEELRALMGTDQRPQVVDARPRNYVSRDPDAMPSAVWRDPDRVDDWCGQLSSDAPVFVYCAYGFEVGCNVATALRQRGFDARYVRGGLAAWCGAEGPRASRAAG